MSHPQHAASGSHTASSNNNWKNPSTLQMVKYNLRPLPADFEPTEEEQQLLDMYEVIRNHERVAARLKEEAARAKLAASDAEFQRKLAPLQNKNKRKRSQKSKAANTFGDNQDDGGGDDDDDDLEEDEDDSDDDNMQEDEDDEEETLHDRREAKLAELRVEVEEAKHAIAPVKDHADALLREQHLAVAAEGMEDEPMLKRKRKDLESSTTSAPSSLLANLTAAATPPHEFSEKLELTNRGKVLFPTTTASGTEDFKWTPPEGVFAPNDGAFTVDLKDFDVTRAHTGSGNNTVAIKFMAPSDSKRFSINITTAEDSKDNFNSVLFHFNPRQRERGGQLVVNDKQDGIWGQAIPIPLSQVPLMFGQTSCTLLIQINGEGFDVFLENKHCVRLEHRKELPVGNTNLVLQFPSTDDYGSPENWVVYKVWWGNRPILAKADVSGVPGVNSFSSEHPRKVFLSGLGKIFTGAEVDLRRAELERAFRKYGGDRGVHVIVPTNSTYAFVEMESERMADLALQELSEKYRMNRARRSRHEALQEERAAAEAGKSGATKSDSVWD